MAHLFSRFLVSNYSLNFHIFHSTSRHLKMRHAISSIEIIIILLQWDSLSLRQCTCLTRQRLLTTQYNQKSAHSLPTRVVTPIPPIPILGRYYRFWPIPVSVSVSVSVQPIPWPISHTYISTIDKRKYDNPKNFNF